MNWNTLVILHPQAIFGEVHLQQQMDIHISRWTNFLSASDIACYEEPFNSSVYDVNTKLFGSIMVQS